jgi:hypothetical protein
MASSSKHENARPDLSVPLALDRLVGNLPAQFREHPLTTPVEMVSFWLAVALPFLYLPLLVSGVTTDGELLSVLVLVALNAVALLIGHDHRNEQPAQ